MLMYTLFTKDYPIAVPVGFSLAFSILLGASKLYIDAIENLS